MSDRLITDLCPELQPIYKEWLSNCKDAGLNVAAIVTWRSSVDQNAAKAQGLSKAGAGSSPHNCCNDDGSPNSKAFDFGVFEDDGKYVTDGKDPRYTQAAEIGKSLGLVWGGEFHSIFDPDHLELKNWRTDSETMT